MDNYKDLINYEYSGPSKKHPRMSIYDRSAQFAPFSALNGFSDEELNMIYNGIYNHSDKEINGFWFDEIIKDADSLQHALRNPMEDYFFTKDRLKNLLNEIM